MDEIREAARTCPTASAWPWRRPDQDVLEAVRDAVDWGVVSAILVGDEAQIRQLAQAVNLDLAKCQVVAEPDPVAAARKAVAMVATVRPTW